MATSETLDIQNDIISEMRSLVSYLHDVYIEGDKEELEVSAFRRKLDIAKEDFNTLQVTFDKTDTELNNDTKSLTHINNEIALNKKKITDIRNEIFSLSRLKGEVDQFAVKLALQYERLEKTLNDLEINKEMLTKSIEERTLLTKQAVASMADYEVKISEMKVTLRLLSEEKKQISENIGNRLKKTSIDHDKFEKEFFALNLRLLRHMEKRTEINAILKEKDQPVKLIRDYVERLKADLSTLNDLKDIPGARQLILDQITKLEGETISIDTKIAEIKAQIPLKQAETETLSKKNMERRSSLNALDREIGAFEVVYTENINTKKTIEELQKLREDALKEMEDMLNGSIELEERLLETEAVAKAIVKEKV
jgi:chromosome segregation ATPase